MVPQGGRAAARPFAQQGHGVHRGRARCAGPARPPAAPPEHPGGAGRAGAGELPPQDVEPREVHQPLGAARPQRDAVLPRHHRPSRRDDADHLHADRRPRLPAVRAHLPARARPVRQRDRPPPDRERAAQLARAQRQDDRRHRRRAHPRPRRPRRQRHGHPDRQARAVHGGGRHRPDALPARRARRRHQQREPPQRPALHRPAPEAAHRGAVRRTGRRVHPRRTPRVPRRHHPVRGLRQPQRVPAAEEVPQRDLHLQRRHPGHRRGRAGGPHLGAARHRRPARGPARPVPRRGRGGDRHRRAHRGGDPGRGRRRRGGARRAAG